VSGQVSVTGVKGVLGELSFFFFVLLFFAFGGGGGGQQGKAKRMHVWCSVVL